MTPDDQLEIKQAACGYYRTVRNLQRNRGSEGKAIAAQQEIDRLKFEIEQIRKSKPVAEAVG
jgi:hypothetical protein